ncbi:terminase large subunit domain-containing protein [Methanosphaera sp.]|jgi:hypothetical protein|uniref:terminase large subunit domain-containing protein n=1 Tax=Methanosphaera sp. TaxID=2666342 RepID=UPI003D8ED578
MKVDYTKLKFSETDKQIYGLTILDNPYIIHKPFPKQAAAIMHPSQQKLLGGNAFSGKAVALDTLIPTPNGFTPIKNIHPGSYVYGTDGKPVLVEAESNIYYNHTCYNVSFDDNSEIICDANHLWTITNKNSEKNITITTENLFQLLNNYSPEWCIQNTLPLKYENNMNLPIDPYILGVYFACNNRSIINSLNNDIINKIKQHGYTLQQDLDNNDKLIIPELQEQLKNISLNNIGILYLFSSVEQRLELIRGLMDIGGDINYKQECIFNSENVELIHTFKQILCSLGITVRIYDHYTLCFKTNKPVFTLTSKLDKLPDKLTLKDKSHFIINIKQVESVPVKCIRVKSENHLYLCTNNYIATHNSLLGSMIASQWLMYPNYRCLILRRTYDDVVATGGIVDYLKRNLLDYDRLGEHTCELNEAKKVFTAPSGAKIFYNYSQRKGDKEKFRGRSYHTIIWDEASESPKENLAFIVRSNRRDENQAQIPLHTYYISNPSLGDGTQYLLKNFVEDTGRYPYFELTFWDNQAINPKEYAKTLENLDPIDRAFQLYGDWHFMPSNGMILKRAEFEEMETPNDWLDSKHPDYNIVGVDLASTGDDKTACMSITHFSDGTTALCDSLTIKSSQTEIPIRRFLEKQQKKYHTNIIVFEKEVGASPEYAKRYWYGQLEDLLIEGKTSLAFYHPTDSKFERARPIAQSIRRKFLAINDELPDKHALLNQFLYVHPDRDVMNDFPSPDVLDASSLCFNHMSMFYKLGVDKLSKAYHIGVK